ncbi:MAG TPA: carboxylating nicotinate-nucleotide diphosphorylase [Bacteroidia bacterium]|jgi:nicotinate-nucleotide pyrophosphorylase (carboxylating)|nr:carboxylating nicotinate-nucleotide diphosphorylase [Bacteroidia bacterium]
MNKPGSACSSTELDSIRHFIRMALQEDVGEGDHTSLACIKPGIAGKARLLVKEKGILAGQDLAGMIFQAVDPALQVSFFILDGAAIQPGDCILEVQGDEQNILKAERLVLNCMQRMSGIASTTSLYANRIAGTKAKVLDTRKTTPGMRILEKWAVRIGGGTNHRMGLYDMILIKDNHVDYAGGIGKAIAAANDYLVKTKKKLEIEIEVRNFDELDQVLETGGIQRIMLDNFSPENLATAVKKINGRYKTEASGGITIDTILSYAISGVDYISVGALTHSVKSLDLSLKAVR